MNTNANYIQEGEFLRRNHILDQFSDNGIEKAITEQDFNSKYGQGHTVFTMEGINKFISGATKEGATKEIVKGIEDELKTLSKVVIKTEDGYESRYVREIKEVDVSLQKGEESEEQENSKKDLSKSEAWEILEKGVKVPIGTISNGRKKIAEGKWRPVGKGDNSSKKADEKEFSVGKSVKLKDDIYLISLSDIKGQKLTVVGEVNTGLISAPIFIKVKDKDGETHEINPSMLESHKESSTSKPKEDGTAKVNRDMYSAGQNAIKNIQAAAKKNREAENSKKDLSKSEAWEILEKGKPAEATGYTELSDALDKVVKD